MRDVHALAAALALAGAPTPARGGEETAAHVTRGDVHYLRRAEGARGAVAAPGPIEAALAEYRAAHRAGSTSLLVSARLMRALFFRAAFCPTTPRERTALLEEGRRAGEQALRPLARPGGAHDHAARVRATPHAIDAHFWAAVCWGEWSLARGTMAAARAGAGGRIRDLAAMVRDVDPAFEQGGGDRLLGRLHHLAPRIPLFTGWVSRRAALEHLRAALVHGPGNSVNRLFLAEALLDLAPEARGEARELLVACANEPPRAEYLVEDAHYAALARARLARLR